MTMGNFDQKVLDKIVKFDHFVFNVDTSKPLIPEADGVEYANRVFSSNGIIYYVTETFEANAANEMHGISGNGEILGFIFVEKEPGGWYIWLASTHPERRRRGIMRMLFEHAEKLLGPNDRMRVITYPAQFPNMPPFLARNGLRGAIQKRGYRSVGVSEISNEAI